MDVILSAVASELMSRLFSFLIERYQERGATSSAGTDVKLQRALVRAKIIIEEAERRQIANRAMLMQLNQLRCILCRATHALDAFRWRATNPSRSRRLPAKISRSQSLTRPPPIRDTSDILAVMLEALEATLNDMSEFVMLLGSFPLITRQPYSTYLFMENCMFGRQMEKEEIIIFLLKPSEDLDVLPVIGPCGVGKRTLVDNVCLDERVRERFSVIYRLRSDQLDHQIHEHDWSLFDFTARSLMVVAIIESDAHCEESWRRFYSTVRRRSYRGSKIIVMSRSEVHSSMGTVLPITLREPHREEIWYFFRALAFGAADPDERPDLARIALALMPRISDFPVYAAANHIAASLRANVSARSWRRVLKMYMEATVLQLGATGNGFQFDDDKDGYCFLCQPITEPSRAPLFFYNRRKLNSVVQSETPKVTVNELLIGGANPPAGETRFEALVWKSRIPPYDSYISTCDTNTAHLQVLELKKRLLNKRVRQTPNR